MDRLEKTKSSWILFFSQRAEFVFQGIQGVLPQLAVLNYSHADSKLLKFLKSEVVVELAFGALEKAGR